jgi:hypothetical protein
MAPADPILDIRFTLMDKIEGALRRAEVFWDLIPLPFLDSGVLSCISSARISTSPKVDWKNTAR